MLVKKILAAGICATTLISGATNASIIESNHAIGISTDSPLESDGQSGYSTGQFYSQSFFDGDLAAYGDLTTGKVGAGSHRTDRFGARVTLFDTLSFSTATEILFNYTLDGKLSSDNEFSLPEAFGLIAIYDITGLDNWIANERFEGDEFDTLTTVEDISSPVYTGLAFIFLDVIGSAVFSDGEFEENVIEHNLAADGTVHDVQHIFSGSFMVDPDKVYGIRLEAGANSTLDSSANFLSTGTFQFTDLGGSTFESSSGVFLSEQVRDVPEPSAILMLLSAFGILGFQKFKRSRFAL